MRYDLFGIMGKLLFTVVALSLYTPLSADVPHGDA